MGMSTPVLFLLVAVAASIFAAWAIVRVTLHRSAPGTLAIRKEWSAEVDGAAYRCVRTHGDSRRPGSLFLSMPCPVVGQWSLRQENPLDGLAKRIGLAVELQTGDPEFDNAVYVSTDDPDYARRFFEDAGRRAAITRLMADGYPTLELTNGTLTAQRTPYQHPTSDEAVAAEQEAVNRAARALAEIRQDAPSSGGASRFPLRWRSRSLMVFPVLAVVSGIVSRIAAPGHILDDSDLFWWSLRYSVPAAALFAAVAYRSLKGHSDSHWMLMVIALAAFFAFPFGGSGLSELVNSRMDTAPEFVHEVDVVTFLEVRSKNSTYYELRLKSWRPDRDFEYVPSDRQEYESAPREPLRVQLATRPGALGFEWVVRRSPIP
jgi:hypothetical protein